MCVVTYGDFLLIFLLFRFWVSLRGNQFNRIRRWWIRVSCHAVPHGDFVLYTHYNI
jgi:hypothetical protein